MVEVWVNDTKKIDVPSIFDELSADQLSIFIQEVEMKRSELFELEEGQVVTKDPEALYLAQVKLLKAILGLSEKEFHLMDPHLVRDLLITEQLCAFFFKDLMSLNPVPVVEIYGEEFHGPIRDFHQLVYEEFGTADKHFMEYQRTREAKELDALVAVLYRKKDPHADPESHTFSGDIRLPFNLANYETRLQAIAKLDLVEKLKIYIWFSDCRYVMLKHYEKVFSHKESDSNKKSTWVDTALALGDGLVNFDKIRKERCYMVMQEMERLIEKQEEAEKQIKKKNGSTRV